MNMVINYASGKPSDPLCGYSYLHDSNLRQPHQIVVTLHKMLLVTTARVRSSIFNCDWKKKQDFPSHLLQTDTK